MKRNPRSIGISLAELIISSALMLLLLSMVYKAVAAGLYYQRRIEAQLDLDQKMLQAMAFISREVGETSIDGCYVNPFFPDCLIFTLARNPDGKLAVDASGQLLWDKVVCYRTETVDGVTNLIRQEEMVGGDHLIAVSPSSLLPIRDKEYFENSNLPKRTISTQVTKFNSTVIFRKHIEMTLATEISDGRQKYGMEAKTVLATRN